MGTGEKQTHMRSALATCSAPQASGGAPLAPCQTKGAGDPAPASWDGTVLWAVSWASPRYFS